MDDIFEVKTVRDCEELAVVDAYDEIEAAGGWFACLEEVFSTPQKIEVLGEELDFVGFGESAGCSIVGVCKKKNKKANVALDSIKFKNASKIERLWVKAYMKCAN